MANESIEHISETQGHIGEDGTFTASTDSLIDGAWMDGIELRGESIDDSIREAKNSMGDFYSNLIEKMDALLNVFGATKNPDGSIDTDNATPEGSDANNSEDNGDNPFEGIGDQIKQEVLGGDKFDETMALTNKTSGVSVNDLEKIPLGIGSGFALLDQTLHLILDKISAKDDESNETKNTEKANTSFAEIATGIGNTVVAFAAGITMLAGAVALLSVIDISAAAVGTVALLMVLLGGIITGLTLLASRIEGENTVENLNAITDLVLRFSISVAIIGATTALLVLTVGFIRNNLVAVALAFGFMALTMKIIFDGIDELANDLNDKDISSQLDSISNLMLKFAISIAIIGGTFLLVTFLWNYLESSGGREGLIWLLGTVAGLIIGIGVIGTLAKDGADSIDAAGNAMLKIGITMAIIAGTFLLTAFVWKYVQENDGLAGIIFLISTTGGLLLGMILIGTIGKEGEGAIIAAGIAMVLASVAILAIAAAFYIIGQIPMSAEVIAGISLLLATTMALMAGIIVIGIIGQANVAAIIAAGVAIALAGAAVLMVGYAFSIVAQAVQTAGGGVGGILTLGAAVVLMLATMGVIIIAAAAIGIIGMVQPEIILALAIGIAVIGAAALVLMAVGEAYLLIAQAVQAAGGIGQAMLLGVVAIAMIASMLGIMAAMGAFGIASVIFVPLMLIASVGLLALLGALEVFSQIGQLIGNIPFETVIENARQATVMIGSIALLAASIAAFGVGILYTLPYIAIATVAVVALGGILTLMSESLADPLATFVNTIQVETALQASLRILTFIPLAFSLSMAGIGLAAASVVLSLTMGSLEVVKDAFSKMEDLATSAQTLADNGISEPLNQIAADIDNIQFGLGSALKLRLAMSALEMAFGGPLLNSGSIQEGMAQMSKSIEGLASIEKVADGFERLAALSDPLNEVAASMREVAEAAKEISDANIPEALDGLKDFKQPEEEKPEEIEKPVEKDNTEKFDEIIAAINAMSSNLASIATYVSGITNASSAGPNQQAVAQGIKN